MNTKLYRATDDGYGGQWSCWSVRRETAAAYTEEGLGHGGREILEMDADLESALDLRCHDMGVDFVGLAEALGYEDAEGVSADWRMSGWLYPWEESGEVRQRLADSGYAWVRYLDDYPARAETVMRLTLEETNR